MIKRITLLTSLFLFIANIATAQNWGGGIDDERLNFGFSFQYVVSEYKLTKTRNWRAPYFDADQNQYVTDSLKSLSSPTSAGFGIGFLVKSKLTSHIDARFTPALVFNDRLLNYNYVDNRVNNPSVSFTERKVQATMIDLPVGLRLRSDRLGNFRAYMLGGIKYSIDLASEKKTNDDNAAPINKLVKNKRSFLSYEAGIGFELYFEQFKVSPELKVSHSFKDIVIHTSNPYTDPIEKAKLRHFTFSLFFE